MKNRILIFVLIFLLSLQVNASSKDRKYNILFIAVDDLRSSELSCYGTPIVKTPYIDHLASEGILFNHAYVQLPQCMPSRASILTGFSTEKFNIYDRLKVNDVLESAPNALSLTKFFENHGYLTKGFGKVYHYESDAIKQFSEWTDGNPESKSAGRDYMSPNRIIIDKDGRGFAFESPNVEDSAYRDGYNAVQAARWLRENADNNEPFFLAIGFHKPHLPWNAPQKYWDLYSKEEIKLADNEYLPKNHIKFNRYDYRELVLYAGIPKGQYCGMPEEEKAYSDELKVTLKHGYYACISYIDTQLGIILNALKESGLDKNTIVIFWSDHGWKLGEHDGWGKHTNFELDTHVPFIIKVPGLQASATDNFVELLDIYPTLADLCGFDIPEHVDGKSLVSVIENPDIVQYHKAYSLTPYPDFHSAITLGYSVRTEDYRYVEWVSLRSGNVEARELYDQRLDPDENINIAEYFENKPICEMYSKLLKTKWVMKSNK